MGAAAGAREQVRELVTSAVQWAPARDSIKRGAHLAARGRARVLTARGTMPEIANIFTASCPKSGSQWIKAVFHHPIVRSHTGLFTLPQFDYRRIEVHGFPTGTYVPGLYLSYDQYARIPKPLPHRTVYVFRDPRDIVVSAYFSGLETHRLVNNLEERRAKLREMSIDEGLIFAMENGEAVLRSIQTWIDVPDENVRTWRLEDISADPATHVPAILTHCGVHLRESEMSTVLAETSREALQRKDLAARKPGSESHYRVRRQGFRELFGPEHYATLERIVPGLVERLGYPA